MKRDFDDIIHSLKESIASYSYYVDFSKVYQHVSDIEVNLNILNFLLGRENFDEEFKTLITKYPEVISVIPILLAVRKKNIIVIDGELLNYNFDKATHSVNEYLHFLKKTGLKDLFINNHIKNLVDYVTGVEVGLDSNARKNRSGRVMEDIVESFIEKINDIEYLAQATKEQIKNKFNTHALDALMIKSENGKTNKRFDYAVKNKNGHIYLFETNFYGSNGSKLNETARSYSKLANDIKEINGVSFIWITDGMGWNKAKNSLLEAYNYVEHMYTLYDLEHGVLQNLLKE